MQINIGSNSIHWLCEGIEDDDLSLLAPTEANVHAALRAPKPVSYTHLGEYAPF